MLRKIIAGSVFMLFWHAWPYFTVAQPTSTQPLIDSLERVLPGKSQTDTSRITIYKSLSKLYVYKDARKAIDYAQEGINLSNRLGIPVNPLLYLNQARGFARIPDFENAERLYSLALETAGIQKDTVNLAAISLSQGWHYYNLQNITAANKSFNNGLVLAERLGDKVLQGDAWFGIALVYYRLDDMKSMQEALLRYLDLASPVTQQSRLADTYRLLGLYYRSVDQFQEAIDANQKSYDIAESIGDSIQMGAALNHMAWYYYEMGNLEKSLQIYKDNLAYYSSGGSSPMANIYGNMGNIYRDWERYPEAIDNYNRSIELSLAENDLYNLSWLYEDISKMYERIGDYRQAYENMQLAALYQDSVASVTYQQQLASYRAQYEADRNARELELLSLKLQRNRFLNWMLAAGFGLALAVAALVVTRLRYKNRQRIEAMNRKIAELQQTNMRQQMNPHFIFNTLNSIQYYVFQNDRIASNNYMTKFASLIRKTLENSRHTTIPIKEELETLRLYLELEALRFKQKFEWDIDIDEEIDTLVYKIPTMLIQPYVENAITHGLMNKDNGKGSLKIDIELQNNQILCTIEDNGIGRARAMEIKRQKNNNHESMGTTITESRLKLVNELYGNSMKVSYTDLQDAHGEPAGTRVQVNIPLIT